MKKTLYDLLELSPHASDDAIHAAHQRLAAKCAAAAGCDPDAEMKAKLIKDAFVTLSNPELRRSYDASQQVRRQAKVVDELPEEFAAPFWTGGKVLIALLCLVLAGGYYVKSRNDAAIEQAQAAAKALEAEARQAELDAERLRSEQSEASRNAALERQQRADYERFKREADANARQLQAAEEYQRRRADSENRQRERDADAQRRRDEAEAQRRIARDVAEARRLDYERSAPRAVSISR